MPGPKQQQKTVEWHLKTSLVSNGNLVSTIYCKLPAKICAFDRTNNWVKFQYLKAMLQC